MKFLSGVECVKGRNEDEWRRKLIACRTWSEIDFIFPSQKNSRFNDGLQLFEYQQQFSRKFSIEQT
jgi:hypothetical protein